METITTDAGWKFDVEFEYIPAKRTNEFDDPETLEIESVQFDGNLAELFDHYLSTEQIMDSIRDRIRETH